MDTDVLICGAGPVGLILAYQLRKMGISVYLVEQTPNTNQTKYGRAGTISPRTMELLDQLGLADSLLQQGFSCKETATFKDGQRVDRRGWNFVTNISDTAFNFILHVRQMHTERVFRQALEKEEGSVHEGSRMVDFSVTEAQQKNASRYTVILENSDGSTTLVNARYIVGADGGRSTVRKLAGIKFLGDSTALNWVRLDAVVSTDMPDSRVGPVSIETEDHGNVLWAPMDHGRTRIGFPYTPRMRERYGSDPTQADIEFETIQALRPFHLTLNVVDLWTIYSVGHRLAEHYFVSPTTSPRLAAPPDLFSSDDWTCGIFLAGDAAHTHSSGTAQGMNAGIHDAINLAWKLAGVIKGWFDPKILGTYESERRPAAVEIIKLDKSISSLMSGQIPKTYTGPETDPSKVFGELLDQNAQLTVGLGIHYKADDLLNLSHSTGSVLPGHRAPDVLVNKPGTLDQIRLYTIMQNSGRFWILVFGFSSSLNDSRYVFEKLAPFCESATLIAGQALSVDDALQGLEPLGNAYFDVDHNAHKRYGFDVHHGGIAVVRPDGILGYACPLDRVQDLDHYFDAFVCAQADEVSRPLEYQGLD
ncbi:MAG: hypothetical protein LQ338_007343 [Usnochroma carphineum]|nr:MAG: hypothetical protein LQ338_007343 [Usnochroma carphineum]